MPNKMREVSSTSDLTIDGKLTPLGCWSVTLGAGAYKFENNHLFIKEADANYDPVGEWIDAGEVTDVDSCAIEAFEAFCK